MSNNLLQKLMAAQTDEERSWIVTENLLESLPEKVARALWAVAVPHWFDGEILAALCPELADRADEIYRLLQELSCVEVFPERGHNVHELTRNQLLDRLWQDNQERFRDLSRKAAIYFSNGDRTELEIEWIYNLAVTGKSTLEDELQIQKLRKLEQKWDNVSHSTELLSLISNLKQQIDANRITGEINAEILTSQGESSELGNLVKRYSSNDINFDTNKLKAEISSLVIDFLNSKKQIDANQIVPDREFFEDLQDKITEFFRGWGSDLLQQEREALRKKAANSSIGNWKAEHFAYVIGSGAITGTMGGTIGLVAIAADLLWCKKVGIQGCLGIGHISGCKVDYEQDMNMILAVWSGLATATSLPVDKNGNAINKTSLIIAAKVAAKSLGKGSSKIGIKVIEKPLLKSGSKMGAKLATKAASKAATKLTAKLAVKSSFGLIPLIGGAVSAGINWWLLNGLLDSAEAYYTSEYIVINDDEISAMLSKDA